MNKTFVSVSQTDDKLIIDCWDGKNRVCSVVENKRAIIKIIKTYIKLKLKGVLYEQKRINPTN